jgi:serine phosphatase RsbU (regulator of sigma subunit)
VTINERKKAQSELTIAHDKLGDAMAHIEGSINYASRIQRSVLPNETLFESLFKDYFILWEPRDVVGGDIYWANMWGNGVILILGDCTGHGVPGAFMTLITTGAMDRALTDTEEGNVGEFLQHVHKMVQVTLGQHGQDGESDDGMELGVCYFLPDGSAMKFAGARFDLLMIKHEEVSVIKATKSGIGYRGIPFDQEFAEHRIELTNGHNIYMTSDGLIDQVGGERGRMFGNKRFKELLLSVQDKPMSEQKETIFQALLDYQDDENRRDDVSVIGFKV